MGLDERATVGIKLDGSLCSPLLLDGELRWATRSQLSDPIAAFAAARSKGYVELCTAWIADGWTPLFEWCEATRTPGVVQHPRDSLTLIAMRHSIRGNYLGSEALAAAAAAYQVPVADQISVRELIGSAFMSLDNPSGCAMSVEQSTATVEALQRAVREWEGVEGGVLLTTSHGGTQQMVKMKSNWWLSMAAASKQAGPPFLLTLLRLRPSLAHVPPEALWSVALHDKRDDLLPPCVQLLQHAGEMRSS